MKEVKFCLAGGFGSAELVDDDAHASILALDAGGRCKWTAQGWSSEPCSPLPACCRLLVNLLDRSPI